MFTKYLVCMGLLKRGMLLLIARETTLVMRKEKSFLGLALSGGACALNFICGSLLLDQIIAITFSKDGEREQKRQHSRIWTVKFTSQRQILHPLQAQQQRKMFK